MPYESGKELENTEEHFTLEAKEEAYQNIQKKLKELHQDVLDYYEKFPEETKHSYELPTFLNPYY